MVWTSLPTFTETRQAIYICCCQPSLMLYFETQEHNTDLVHELLGVNKICACYSDRENVLCVCGGEECSRCHKGQPARYSAPFLPPWSCVVPVVQRPPPSDRAHMSFAAVPALPVVLVLFFLHHNVVLAIKSNNAGPIITLQFVPSEGRRKHLCPRVQRFPARRGKAANRRGIFVAKHTITPPPYPDARPRIMLP